eukprot:TRINITY_DN2349_c0_g1_i3.p1 TRINITY_DN2349_c0_g1~~TRINITY_DN2349_c0_g1_i3.p1  ORF type:complete len:126 (+),score=4.77 TRINITY_DN2349_c0_g1_i3:84-461(+)
MKPYLISLSSSTQGLHSYTKNGNFAVKSAYQIASTLFDPNQCKASSSDQFESKVWMAIWRCQVPSKIKGFSWKACKDILPPRQNLHKKMDGIDPICGICGKDKESTIHVTFFIFVCLIYIIFVFV